MSSMKDDEGSPSLSAEASERDLVGDGMLLVLAGVRMTVKNLIIVRALRDGADYDEDWYVSAVQHEFVVMAAEKNADADRVEAAARTASKLRGTANHQSDYRKADQRMLARRITVLRALATALATASEDTEHATALVHGARTSALDDIAGAMQPSQDSDLNSADRDAIDPADHRDQLTQLKKELRKLAKKGPPRG